MTYQTALNALSRSRNWVRLILVSGGLLHVFLMARLISKGLLSDEPLRVPTALVLVLWWATWLPPLFFLWRYSRAIGYLETEGGPDSLAEALKSQASFWKFTGIAVLLVLVAFLFLSVVGIWQGFGRAVG